MVLSLTLGAVTVAFGALPNENANTMTATKRKMLTLRYARSGCGCSWVNEDWMGCSSEGARFVDQVNGDAEEIQKSYHSCYIPCGGRANSLDVNGSCEDNLLQIEAESDALIEACDTQATRAYLQFQETDTIKDGNDFCESLGLKCEKVLEGDACQTQEHKYAWRSTCDYSAGEGAKHIAVCKKDYCDCSWVNEENTSCESDGGRFIDNVAWDQPEILPNSFNACYLPCGGRSNNYKFNGACPKTLLKELKITELKGGEACDDKYNSAWIKFATDEENSSGKIYCAALGLKCSKVFKSDQCENHRKDYVARYSCDLDWDEPTNLVVQCDGERGDTGRPKPWGNAPSTASWKNEQGDAEDDDPRVGKKNSPRKGMRGTFQARKGMRGTFLDITGMRGTFQKKKIPWHASNLKPDEDSNDYV